MKHLLNPRFRNTFLTLSLLLLPVFALIQNFTPTNYTKKAVKVERKKGKNNLITPVSFEKFQPSSKYYFNQKFDLIGTASMVNRLTFHNPKSFHEKLTSSAFFATSSIFLFYTILVLNLLFWGLYFLSSNYLKNMFINLRPKVVDKRTKHFDIKSKLYFKPKLNIEPEFPSKTLSTLTKIINEKEKEIGRLKNIISQKERDYEGVLYLWKAAISENSDIEQKIIENLNLTKDLIQLDREESL